MGRIVDWAYILGQRLEACSTQKTWYPLRRMLEETKAVLVALEIVLSSCALGAQLCTPNSNQKYIGSVFIKKVVHKVGVPSGSGMTYL